MKRTLLSLISVSVLLGLGGCSFKVTKPMLQMVVSGSNKVSAEPAYADSLEKRIGVPYVAGESQEVNGRMIEFMNRILAK